jgi:S1-C subfamily serine protease
MKSRWVIPITAWTIGFMFFSPSGRSAPQARDVNKHVLQAEADRIAVIEKIRPAVVAVFSPGGQGGGSGVLISKDGYALSNFHVVQGAGPVMQCGLPDGVLYDAVVVGLDKVGDVALIKLLPKKDGQEFPSAKLGNSDNVKAGDWSLALGNPFLLATDFTPTVTFGLVSGVHRYQYPESSRGLLEYTDCIQVDTSINPGNSGGPLFNMAGELIGINGRISIEKRGRVNSGVGYAISINQIKNFMGHLRAGLDADHATLGAFIENKEDDTQGGMVVTRLLENSDAHRRGLDLGDEVVSFAGRIVANRNQYQNVLGIYPKGWRVPLVYRRDNVKHEILVRLMGILPQEAEEGREGQPQPRPQPGPRPSQPRPVPNSPANKLYEAKSGFANYYFNRLERDRLWAGFRKHGDFSGQSGAWTIEAEFESNQKKTPAKIVISEEKSADGKARATVARLTLGEVTFQVEPLKPDQSPSDLKEPHNSGGLLAALYQYRRLLTLGEKGFEQYFSHGGSEPFYPMPPDIAAPASFSEIRVDTEVLQTEHAATPVKWHFSIKDQSLLGLEATVIKDEDPCEIYFSDYRKVDGRELPHRIEARYGNGRFGVFHVSKYDLSPAVKP